MASATCQRPGSPLDQDISPVRSFEDKFLMMRRIFIRGLRGSFYRSTLRGFWLALPRQIRTLPRTPSLKWSAVDGRSLFAVAEE